MRPAELEALMMEHPAADFFDVDEQPSMTLLERIVSLFRRG